MSIQPDYAYQLSALSPIMPHGASASSVTPHDLVCALFQAAAIWLEKLTYRAETAFSGPDGAPAPKAANIGDNDAAPESQPSQFLLFRGLDHSVTEQLFAKGATKLFRPSSNSETAPPNSNKGSKVASTTGDSKLGAREGSIRRVLLVRDRKTNQSWGYGFVEFAGVVVCSILLLPVFYA